MEEKKVSFKEFLFYRSVYCVIYQFVDDFLFIKILIIFLFIFFVNDGIETKIHSSKQSHAVLSLNAGSTHVAY